MKYCWYEPRSKVLNGIIFLLKLIVLIDFTIASVSYLSQKFTLSLSPEELLFSIFLASVVVCLLGAFFLIIIFEERTYQIDANGLTIGYPLGIRKSYSWNIVTAIGICKVRYNRRGPVHHKTAIRFAIGEENNGPEQARYWNEPWSKYTYEILHFSKIITVEFSESRLGQLAAVCPVKITDYRHLPEL